MSQNNQANNPNDNTATNAEMDRLKHDSGSFFYKYRWWIVLVLAILLAYFLYNKRTELGIMSSDANPRITATELKIGTPTVVDMNTDVRNLFRLN